MRYTQLLEMCQDADVVVNLAGANLGTKRWSPERREEIVNSRVDVTRQVVQAIAACDRKPALVSMSAVGYYGNTMIPSGEALGHGSTFLGELCNVWEHEAMQASTFTRVVILRMGIILDPREGALAKILPFMKAWLGGVIGTGRQWFPWIHRDDAVEATIWAILSPDAYGPYNIVAPESVTMKTFIKELGAATHRPTLIPVLPILVRILYGKMGDTVLHGQLVKPVRLLGTSFRYAFPTLRAALKDLIR